MDLKEYKINSKSNLSKKNLEFNMGGINLCVVPEFPSLLKLF